MGCLVSRMSLLTAGMAPLSSLPKKLSASSRIMSFLLPSEEDPKLPSSEKESNMEPRRATFSMSSAERWSDAFISTMSHPISRARASADVVLPIPGEPINTTARFSGTPDDQLLAHALRVLTAEGFPTTPSSVRGRYFSVQSLISESPQYHDPEQVGHLIDVQRHAQEDEDQAVGPGGQPHVPVQRGHGQEHHSPYPLLQHQMPQTVD